MKGLYWKLAAAAAVTLTAILYVLPTVNPNLWPYKKINLGLDLQGGMHIVLAVDTDKAIENTINQVSRDMRSIMRSKQIRALSVENTDKKRLRVLLESKNDVDKLNTLLKSNFNNFKRINYTLTDNAFHEVILELHGDEANRLRRFAVEQTLETIRNRIDQFGVSEPDIRLHGTQHILIQLPGVKDTHRAKELIGRTALLEFRIVKNNTPSEKELSSGLIPPGSVVLHRRAPNSNNSNYFRNLVLVEEKADVTGAHLTDARVCIDSRDNTPYVMIKLNKVGAKTFEKVTSENLNKHIAIVLDGNVYSTPVITEVISGGQARITGGFSMEDARDLAIVLRAGALPAPVRIIEERTVGPSLGMDSIKTGLASICVGALLVIFFMAIYYKFAGIVADFALILNMLMVAAGLAAFQATLTLPGIAGIILTLGIAVDANVLIFERIKEETRLGRTPIASVIAGYDRATLTILDANVTTLIAALVLFQFGTGPVKGFAITLSLGILASLFTSLVLTRVIFDYLLIHRRIEKINI